MSFLDTQNLFAQIHRVRHVRVDRRGRLVRTVIHRINRAHGILAGESMIDARGAEILPDCL